MATGAQGYRQVPQDDQRAEVTDETMQPIESAAPGSYIVNLDTDVYDAVVVASFRGVHLKDWDKDKSVEGVAIPPVLLLLLMTMPVFFMQTSLIWALFLDIDLTHPVSGLQEEDLQKKLLFVTQLFLVLVLSVTLLKNFLTATKGIAIILNPRMWKELKQPKFMLGGPVINFLCCLIAKTMEMYVLYNTFSVTLSVLLGSESPQEAIIDGLTASFVVELHSKAFAVAAQVMHFDLDLYEEGAKEFPYAEQRKRGNSYHAFAKTGEIVLAFFLLEIIYVRQMLTLHKAARTGVLPVAHDICNFYDGIQGDSYEGLVKAQIMELGTTYIKFKQIVVYNVLMYSEIPKIDDESIVCDRAEFKFQPLLPEFFDELYIVMSDDPLHSSTFMLLVVITIMLVVYQGYYLYLEHGSHLRNARWSQSVNEMIGTSQDIHMRHGIGIIHHSRHT